MNGAFQYLRINISTIVEGTQHYNWTILCSDVFGFESLINTNGRKITFVIEHPHNFLNITLYSPINNSNNISIRTNISINFRMPNFSNPEMNF